jgi:hypothetical protein
VKPYGSVANRHDWRKPFVTVDVRTLGSVSEPDFLWADYGMCGSGDSGAKQSAQNTFRSWDALLNSLRASSAHSYANSWGVSLNPLLPEKLPKMRNGQW